MHKKAQKIKEKRPKTTKKLKIQNRFSLFMAHVKGIDMDTFNEDSAVIKIENGQQILGPRKKKEDGSQTARGK